MNGTGNIAVDMVYAAMKHYSGRRRIKKVILSYSYWKLFKNYMLRQESADLVEIRTEIQFNNVLICRGSIFMWEHLKCEFYGG